MTPTDSAARRRALVELDTDLLVEAAAGTGKTAVIAGRAAMLLASGVPPAAIAAITFGEAAAAELAARIREFTTALAQGTVPRELACALPSKVDPARSANARRALEHLDRLVATTIHGFCRAIVMEHAVEALIDPGAVVMDGEEADALFERVLSAWLGRRLGADADAGDPISVLALDDPAHAVSTLRALAGLRRRSPGARVATDPQALAMTTAVFTDAVVDFVGWSAAPREPGTAALVEGLSALAAHYRDRVDGAAAFRHLWTLSLPPTSAVLDPERGILVPYRATTWAWRAVVGAQEAGRLRDEAAVLHRACAVAHAELVAAIGSAVLSALSDELDGLLDDHARAKAQAAVLDFDDLLCSAERLLREHPRVRRAVAGRYRHVLVDEVQDTDPLQSAVILAVTGLDGAAASSPRRPGSLFMVGDPKQAIYRFRGADPGCYERLRAAIGMTGPEAVVRLEANFRSVPAVLAHVDRCLSGPLGEPGQPGYARLVAVRPDPPCGGPHVVRLDVAAGRGTRADDIRDAEAAAVAVLCADLIGRPIATDPTGVPRPLRPRDIALLSPAHGQLRRWERALAESGVPVAPLAGKALLRSQEAQDFVALACTLADPRDGLSFAALLRGPLVGLTDAELLAAAAALPPDADGHPTRLAATTDPGRVAHPVLAGLLATLRDLRMAAVRLTPEALLGDAVERLRVRAALSLRSADRGARAHANVDALIRRARSYAVRGLASFAADLHARWDEASRDPSRDLPEGRCDDGEDAVTLCTVHAAKGLEWPVVVAINSIFRPRPADAFVHRRSDGTLHGTLPRLASRGHARAREEEARAERLERVRLWYVACTRARDLLVLPRLPRTPDGSWAGLVDLRHHQLPAFVPSDDVEAADASVTIAANGQDASTFARESARVTAAAPVVIWRAPSSGDPDRRLVLPSAVPDLEGANGGIADVAGPGRARGALIHKLIEEVLTGELDEEAAVARDRATVLLGQLPMAAGDRPDTAECAATALAALSLPGVAELRYRIVPEWPIHAASADGVLVSGRVDAVALDAAGAVEAVLDWKTDLEPDGAASRGHVAQLIQYMAATGADRGALVYVSSRKVVWLSPDGSGRGA